MSKPVPRRDSSTTSRAFPKFVTSSDGREDPGKLLEEQAHEVGHDAPVAGGLPAPGVGGDLERPEVLGGAAEANVRRRVGLVAGLDRQGAAAPAYAQMAQLAMFVQEREQILGVVLVGGGQCGHAQGSPIGGYAASAGRRTSRNSPRKRQRKGCASTRFQCAMKPRTARARASRVRNEPWRITRRCRMLNQHSTWFTHEACLGVYRK